jgi:hypothetical protein
MAQQPIRAVAFRREDKQSYTALWQKPPRQLLLQQSLLTLQLSEICAQQVPP